MNSGAPHCVACTALNIQCTYNRPRKRRGPPNLYLQAQVQAQAQVQNENSPSSSTWITTFPPQERNNPFRLSGLGPPHVIEHIIDDWFELIYSVCPMLHHGTFTTRLSRGDADIDLEFASVVVAVCAATIASLRQNSDYGEITVSKCLDEIERIESQLGGSRRMFSLEWCQMKYNLGVAVLTERGADDELAFRFLSESVMGVKYLIYHRMRDMSYMDQQLLKRLYWLVFAGLCTMDLHGRPSVGLLSAQDNIETLYPLSLSDENLDPIFVYSATWHGHGRSYIPGLNQLCKLFQIWHSSQQLSLITTPSAHLAHLQAHSQRIQRALDYLPPELQWRGGLSQPPSANFGTQVQTANLYITQLHIRSNLLEQMNQLSKKISAMPDSAPTPSPSPVPLPTPTPVEIVQERQSIVDDMLEILYHMPDETLWANGHSLIPKIRDVGGALLDEVRTGDRPAEGNGKAKVNLERLLRKLEALDVHSRRFCM
ncbi:hypothetical protein PVAG01_09686 [Phlyctema vagabunda]|uniref:Transcription factor domain-containing protein n=1 Tax=Phlyctema vagabunda TaxID=108571 RepID=A0ABR4P830_9HELO